MRDENEVKTKMAYWHGVYDALKVPEKAKSDKLETEKLKAQVWLVALDWFLSQGEQANSKLERPNNIKTAPK